MGLIEVLLSYFVLYPESVSFLGSLFLGTTTIILLSVLAGQELVPVWIVFVYAFLGTVISDVVVLLIAQTKKVDLLLREKFVRKSYREAMLFANWIARHNRFMFLFITKFMYGKRTVATLYLKKEKIGKARFLIYDSLATLMWLAIIIPIGWFAGKGIGDAGAILGVQKILLFGVFIVLIVYILRKMFHKVAINRNCSMRRK